MCLISLAVHGCSTNLLISRCGAAEIQQLLIRESKVYSKIFFMTCPDISGARHLFFMESRLRRTLVRFVLRSTVNPNAQVSDTTGDDSSSTVKCKIIISI